MKFLLLIIHFNSSVDKFCFFYLLTFILAFQFCILSLQWAVFFCIDAKIDIMIAFVIACDASNQVLLVIFFLYLDIFYVELLMAMGFYLTLIREELFVSRFSLLY